MSKSKIICEKCKHMEYCKILSAQRTQKDVEVVYAVACVSFEDIDRAALNPNPNLCSNFEQR